MSRLVIYYIFALLETLPARRGLPARLGAGEGHLGLQPAAIRSGRAERGAYTGGAGRLLGRSRRGGYGSARV